MALIKIKTKHGISEVNEPAKGTFQRKQWDRLLAAGELEILGGKPAKKAGAPRKRKAPAARKAPAKATTEPTSEPTESAES